MQTTRGLGLEIRLSAYIDGEVSDAEKAELAEMIVKDDEARRIYETLQAGSAFGNTAFGDFLHDPVPLALVRRIKQGPGINPKAERVVHATLKPVKRKMWPGALAASIALVLAGGLAGFMIGATRTDNAAPTQVAAARTWLDEVADYHRIYASQTTHLAEVPASEVAQIEPWLAASVGVPFTVPDLAAQGLRFEGARLLVAAAKPVAQLLYKDEDGEVFAICFIKAAGAADTDEVAETIRDNLSLLSWRKAGAAYVLVGPSSDAKLDALAKTIEAEI